MQLRGNRPLEARATWLCPTPQDRARVLENSGRVRRARLVASAAAGLTLLYGIPAYGWWLLVLFAISLASTLTVDLRTRRSSVPEYHAAATVVVNQAITAAAAALSGGPRSPMLPLIVIPTIFAAARFRPAFANLATALAIAMTVAAAVVADPAGLVRHPAGVIVVSAVLVGVAAAGRALSTAELFMRDAAVLDPLTGLLNRQGLARRFEELAGQARQTGRPISLLLCDLDHFKEVNDRHGHAAGDAVLRDVAYELRKQLRSFELVYRVGGEEFLVLLPDTTVEDAVKVGERLCAAVRSRDVQHISLTLSIGVATGWGDQIRYTTMFQAADRALYRAKAEGRDRVQAAPEAQPTKLGTLESSPAATEKAGLALPS